MSSSLKPVFEGSLQSKAISFFMRSKSVGYVTKRDDDDLVEVRNVNSQRIDSCESFDAIELS